MKLATPFRKAEQLDSRPITRKAPFQILLWGRRRFIGVCHSEPLECPKCMGAIARFLADEMGNDVDQALNKSAASYSCVIAGTVEQALELRRMTIAACFLGRPDFGGFMRGTTIDDIVVADDIAAPAASTLEEAA